MKSSKQRIITVIGLAAALPMLFRPGMLGAPQNAEAPANRLVTGKLIYVSPMPEQLNEWIQDDLRQWGRYRVTSDPEGVDLEIHAVVPERETKYKERHGVPLPKASPKDKPKESAIDVVDWTTGGRLWRAELADKKADQSAAPQAPGPVDEINAHGMPPDQLALKFTTELRRYVEQLDKPQGP